MIKKTPLVVNCEDKIVVHSSLKFLPLIMAVMLIEPGSALLTVLDAMAMKQVIGLFPVYFQMTSMFSIGMFKCALVPEGECIQSVLSFGLQLDKWKNPWTTVQKATLSYPGPCQYVCPSSLLFSSSFTSASLSSLCPPLPHPQGLKIDVSVLCTGFTVLSLSSSKYIAPGVSLQCKSHPPILHPLHLPQQGQLL